MKTSRYLCGLILALANPLYALAAIVCPQMPDAMTSVNRDVRADFSTSIGKLGPVKAGELQIKTEAIAKNLFDKYPNVDKLVALQTMAATYCSMLVSSNITDLEKLDRWEKFQERVLELKTRASIPQSETRGSRKISNSSATPKLPDKYIFISHGVDDEMSCTLNGDGIASQVFGSGEVRIDVTDKIRKNERNRLFCRVIDKNGGSCYAWDFELIRNGIDSVVKQKYSCCNSACRKNSDEVMSESFDFGA